MESLWEKPVIASATGEIPYRVKHMINGLVVPPRDPKALAEAITILIQDRGLGEKLGEIGKSGVITWSNVVDMLLKIYGEVFNASKG
jgi:glycosyltransferase involved in cell wall biosynthesis